MMLISHAKRYVIDASNFNAIENHLQQLSAICIMKKKLMTRTIFEVPGKETMWLRVRTGDVDCSKNPMTTASLLDKSPDKSGHKSVKRSMDIPLTDYYNDVSFFSNMGLNVVSEQETKRTKWICYYDEIKFTICFDIWPSLEKYIFLSITPATEADDENLEGFINELGVNDYIIPDFPTDVDAAYKQETGAIARSYRYLSFYGNSQNKQSM